MKLIEWRISKKLTRNQAAKLFGVTQDTIRKWETGERKPTENFFDINRVTAGRVKPNDFYKL